MRSRSQLVVAGLLLLLHISLLSSHLTVTIFCTLASGIRGRAYRNVIRRAATIMDEEDPEVLLKQAAEMRAKAEALEELLQAKRRLQNSKEKQTAENEASNLEQEAASVQQRLDEASAKLKRAEAFQLPEVDDIKAEVKSLELESTKLQERIRSRSSSSTQPAATQAAFAEPVLDDFQVDPKKDCAEKDKSCSSCESKSCESKKSPKKADDDKTQAEWESLLAEYLSLNPFQKVGKLMELPPQARKKLLAMEQGERGGVFVLPNETVTMIEDAAAFKASFKRFQPGSLNGFTEAKDARRGQPCLVVKTFRDKTLTCRFDDGVSFDFPMESVEGYSADIA